MIDFGDIWEAFQVLAKSGGLGVIHAEDNDIVMHMYAKLIREGRVGFEHLAEVHNRLSEDLSFRRILRLAESVPGTALYMMHVSAATGVAAIAEARRKQLPIYGETLHQYLLYTAEDYKRPNGQMYHTYPSLKSAEDQAALWDGTARGSIHCIATDELCCTLKDKTIGSRIDDTTGGNSGVEPRLGVMYTEMVVRRGYSLPQYVDLVSSNAAKIMGLYPRKGAIAVGSDADIAILDPTRRGKVTASDLHETDYTPWEGHDIFAWPVMTLLRGKVMVENGRYLATAQDGRYLKRKIGSRRSQRPGAMTAASSDLVCELLTQSLLAWRVVRRGAARKRRRDPRHRAAPRDPRQARASGLPFRWLVTIDDRERPAISVVAVLRQVRAGARSRLRDTTRADRRLSAGADVIEALILTGFLGSGKTTLLGRLLRRPGVLANGRDHQRIRRDRPRPRADRGERGQPDRAADGVPVLQDPQ